MRSAFAIITLVVITHFTANIFGIYDAQIAAGNVWIDNVLHVLVGLAGALLWVNFKKQDYSFFNTLTFVLALAIGWEICELVFYILAPEQALNLKIYSPSVQEAAVDIGSNFLGGVLFILWKYIKK
jgi:Na+-transporting NADH:ubiquinone oxidoreductase subunit NqrE